MSIYDLLELRRIESFPFPHTLRDEEIRDFMERNYLPDAPESFSYRSSHERAYVAQDPHYLQFMRGHFSGWSNVAETNETVVRLFQERPPESVLRKLYDSDRHAWSWFISPIEVIDRPGDFLFGDGQHRITALRLFAPRELNVVCRVFR